MIRGGLLRAIIGLVAAAAGAGPLEAQERATGITITFVANEGVMLSGGGRKVLIDALFEKYETGYAVPAASTQAALAQARPSSWASHTGADATARSNTLASS